jgi:uncharacterized surface protein with fasciclin (FAS1) repeats
MKRITPIAVFFSMITWMACGNNKDNTNSSGSKETTTAANSGQEAVQDTSSQRDVVKVAVGSKDHTTLVAALKQADLVTALSNAGPFTVFAPTNAAFDKLPKGTVDDLMKPEKKTDLQNILQYHVTTSALGTDYFTDGMTLSMVNGDDVKITVKDGKVMLNNSATIVASVRASNGWVHVIDGVLLPPAKK